MAEPQIRVHHLSVRYGARQALRHVSFAAAAGEIVGLLGPNGAGKTSALSVLAGLIRPVEGTVALCGLDVVASRAEAQRVTGFVPQRLALYPSLSARENLLFFGRAAGLRRASARVAAERALALAGLEERRDEAVAAFSGGMRRRLNLVCALLHEPRVLLLDEATVGVDPQSRERIFGAVREQAASGVTVLWSTHQIEEAERLCDRVVLLDHGRVVADGVPSALVRLAGTPPHVDLVTREPLPVGWERGVPGVGPCEPVPEEEAAAAGGALVRVRLDEVAGAARVVERATSLGHEVLALELHRPDLQDAFIALTGRELRD
ncbi:MAG TPA: ABC transporter ATP-binding protein [Myxococcota bacterium]|nr:ABC transporter ATP-binding protein [Myxococcota bacterium]